jgi:predicted metal-dependent hydrolase
MAVVKETYTLASAVLPLTIKNVKGSRGIRIRVDRRGVVVTKPAWVSKKAALAFVQEKRDWIESQHKHRASLPADKVLFRGEVFEIKAASYPPVRAAENVIWAPGESEADRLEATLQWMKRRAKLVIREAVSRWSTAMGVSPKRVGVRDQVSRWGSCSHVGSLSFNWRLIMAPQEVLEYIVIHELAHIKELNHSRRFWMVVAAHCPEYKKHEAWLNANNDALIHLGR